MTCNCDCSSRTIKPERVRACNPNQATPALGKCSRLPLGISSYSGIFSVSHRTAPHFEYRFHSIVNGVPAPFNARKRCYANVYYTQLNCTRTHARPIEFTSLRCGRCGCGLERPNRSMQMTNSPSLRAARMLRISYAA